MFSCYCRATHMQPSSTQHHDRHDIWNHKYGNPYVVFANVCVEVLTTTCVAAVIEFTILALSLVGIRRASRLRESHLAWFLKTQGIVYFVLVLILQLTMIVSGPGSLEICIC